MSKEFRGRHTSEFRGQHTFLAPLTSVEHRQVPLGCDTQHGERVKWKTGLSAFCALRAPAERRKRPGVPGTVYLFRPRIEYAVPRFLMSFGEQDR